MVERRSSVGIEEADLVSVRHPSVRVHAAQIHLVAIPVARDRIDGREHGQAVACGEQRQVVREDPPGDVDLGREVRAHGGIPRRDRGPLRGGEVIRIGQCDVGGHRSVGGRGIARGSEEDHVVDAFGGSGVVAGRVRVRDAAGRDGVGAGQLLGAGTDEALVRHAAGELLRVAAEVGGRARGHRLGADRSGDPSGVVHQDVADTLSDRARAEHQDLASIHDHLEEGPASDQAASVRVGAPLGVGAAAGRAARPQAAAARGACGHGRQRDGERGEADDPGRLQPVRQWRRSRAVARCSSASAGSRPRRM